MRATTLKELSEEHRLTVCRFMHELQSVQRAHTLFYEIYAEEKPYEYSFATFQSYRASKNYRLDVFVVRETSLEDVKKIDFVQAIDRILLLVTNLRELQERMFSDDPVPSHTQFVSLSGEVRRVFERIEVEADRCGIDDDGSADSDPVKDFLTDLQEAKKDAKDDAEEMKNFANLDIPTVNG